MKFVKLFLLLFLSLYYVDVLGNEFIGATVSSGVPKEINSFHISIGDVLSYIKEQPLLYTKSSTQKSYESVTPVLNNLDTLMYLVNYKGGGWELLSADKRFPKVLAYCSSGSVSIDDLFDGVSPHSLFYERMNQVLLAAKDCNEDLRESQRIGDVGSDGNQNTREDGWSEWSTYRSILISSESAEQDHLLITKWNQDGRWAICAPYKSSAMSSNCYTGCMTVAAAQVLYYLHFKLGTPNYTYGNATCTAYLASSSSTVTLNDSNTTFSLLSTTIWSNMAKNKSEFATKNYRAVSALMIRLGYLDNAKYKYTGTSASMPGMKNVLSSEYGTNCNYSNVINLDIIYQQVVQNQMPCILSIWDSGQLNHGHAVVVDGFHRDNKTYRKYQVRNNNYGDIQYRIIEETEATDYVAINWGYDGRGDSNSSGDTIWYLAPTNEYDIYIDWQYEPSGTTYHTIYSMLYNFSAI